MKNTFGTAITLTLFGESHGPAIGAVLDGLCPGLPVDTDFIDRQLARRRPSAPTDTARREPDRYEILSGVFNGHTTGTPLCILIPNTDTRSGDYTYGPARPSHADYAAFCKYHGFEDYRGGGHFSGRITAALVAAGGILLPALKGLGITLGTHIVRCGEAKDRPFSEESAALKAELLALSDADFPVLDASAGDKVTAAILAAGQRGDSIGGITETAISGLCPGLGEPWFDSMEGLLSHALFSIGGIKGVEFGLGFGFAEGTGAELNDPLRINEGRIETVSNRNGGINGGITNGMPVVFRCAVKPTPSISLPQQTVNFIDRTETELTIRGRHDPAIIRRICPVIDSVTALVLCDQLALRYSYFQKPGGF